MDELDQAIEVFRRNLNHDCQHGVRICEALDKTTYRLILLVKVIYISIENLNE